MGISKILHSTRSFLKEFRIRKQILFSMIIVSSLSVFVLGIIIFNISKNTIEKNYKNSHTYNLQVSSNIIDIQLKSIIEIGRTLLENENFIRTLSNEQSQSGYFSSSNQIQIDKTLSDAASHDILIDGMTIINENGNWRYTNKRNSFSGHTKHYYTSDDILKEGWITEARKAKGKEIFFGYNVMIPKLDTDTISYVKNLINPNTGDSVGFLVVNIRKGLLDKAFGRDREGYLSNRYMIVDKAGDNPLIYINGDISSKDKILQHYIQNDSKYKYLYSSYLNETTGWMVVNVIEKSELSEDSSYIGGVILLASIILVILSYYFSNLISERISAPLNLLERTILEVADGNRNVDAQFDTDEIGIIGNHFKELVNNNLKLMERLLKSEIKEREAELLLLQAQINPHFLYNTLDSLYFMAIIKNDDEIADMVLALSNTFKLSLNKGDKLITVSDEIKRMKEYMKIQNMRYNNRFQFNIDIPGEIETEKILTFILQPFVENAMYHGLEAKIGSGFIGVSAKTQGDKLIFEIIDNGVGIEDISKLESGYGIGNVKKRIELFYGETCGVYVTSEKNVGTTITIVILNLSEVELNV